MIFKRYKVYNPGEFQGVMLNLEETSHENNLETIPRYKDQVVIDNKKYFVNDVVFNLGCRVSIIIIRLYRYVDKVDFEFDKVTK